MKQYPKFILLIVIIVGAEAYRANRGMVYQPGRSGKEAANRDTHYPESGGIHADRFRKTFRLADGAEDHAGPGSVYATQNRYNSQCYDQNQIVKLNF